MRALTGMRGLDCETIFSKKPPIDSQGSIVSWTQLMQGLRRKAAEREHASRCEGVLAPTIVKENAADGLTPRSHALQGTIRI